MCDKGEREEEEREEIASRRGSRARGSAGGLLNIIFSARENFSLFRSPTVVVVAAAFPRRIDTGRDAGGEKKKEFPSSLSFRSYVLTACSRRTRRAAPLFVLSFVKLDERSRLGVPSSFLFFFLPACRCRRPIERLKR